MDKIADIFSNNSQKKAPAYQWQDFALEIIQKLSIPAYKKSSVFKIAKEYSRSDIETALNDTLELAEGERWKYFFKIINSYKNES